MQHVSPLIVSDNFGDKLKEQFDKTKKLVRELKNKNKHSKTLEGMLYNALGV